MARGSREGLWIPEVARLGVAIVVAATSSACASDHHVSPWGARGRPALGAFAEAPDLAGKLAMIDEETRLLGLVLKSERKLVVRGAKEPLVLRAYEGKDALGRPAHAVRAASALGVVLAVGPLDATSPRDQATILVEDRSGADLTGDGTPDVVLANEHGALEVWQLSPLGATRIDAEIEVPPTELVAAGGELALSGALDLAVGAGVARLSDVAVLDGGRFTDRAASARARHEELARAAETGPDATRAARAIERAWHRLLAGTKKTTVLVDLDAVDVPAAERAAFDKARARVELVRAR